VQPLQCGRRPPQHYCLVHIAAVVDGVTVAAAAAATAAAAALALALMGEAVRMSTPVSVMSSVCSA